MPPHTPQSEFEKEKELGWHKGDICQYCATANVIIRSNGEWFCLWCEHSEDEDEYDA